MNLRVTQESIADGTRRTTYLTDLRDGQRESLEIFYDLVGDYDIPAPTLLDGFVLAIIFYAMRTGQDICVEGPMSREAVRNIFEFQEAWAQLVPKRYRRIKVFPQSIVESVEPLPERLVTAAFSGGIDSTFTLLRHATGMLGDAEYPLKKDVIFIHGFDVPLDRPDHVEKLKQRTSALLAELKLNLKIIRSNLKDLVLQDWEDSHMAQIASCLHNYSHIYSYALVASSNPYDLPSADHGSNPVTDPLLSGAGLRLIHDGAAYVRLPKIMEIAKNPTATAAVKVCWEGSETYENCGVCLKCQQSILYFMVAGVDHPASFDRTITVADIRTMEIGNMFQCAIMEKAIRSARARGMQEEWVSAVEAMVRRFRASEWLQKSYEQYMIGEYGMCIALATCALELRPDYEAAWNNICVAKIQLGRYEEAIEAADRALALQTGYPLAAANRDWALREMQEQKRGMQQT